MASGRVGCGRLLLGREQACSFSNEPTERFTMWCICYSCARISRVFMIGLGGFGDPLEAFKFQYVPIQAKRVLSTFFQGPLKSYLTSPLMLYRQSFPGAAVEGHLGSWKLSSLRH